mmetsp:Transcript_50609/g.127112  ORF Transcript_50609/g.127112 Transcript_50609/m.127112 type:complete len:700 (+) Transcript_50609:190-2289(+)|eukprot:CAMPEP_0177651254 /NCGR_PEP_ID=MMETSP0447-20121125/12435_1 /TAXON_ID=0 /ORGANISM="Stygamoeba regulata, Strain BSH-02190019" /LENGTH=699 /DNA_ID=CAMNT_0019154293 /DNA_START=167 /DNA_END=2266 /DNA_ORIENTATION=+
MSSSLTQALPRPCKDYRGATRLNTTNTDSLAEGVTPSVPACSAPAYGSRVGWVPRRAEDFGDGGAYPECHCSQYPLGMGLNTARSSTKAGLGSGAGQPAGGVASLNGGTGEVATVSLDADGRIKMETVLGHRGGGKVQASSTALIERLPDQARLELPSDEVVAETVEQTRLALEKRVNRRIAASRPISTAAAVAQKNHQPAKYIRYTPMGGAAAQEGTPQQRIIRMVEMPVDPLEPPKFKHKKVMGGPPSPPAPVMHSPPRKLTREEVDEWRIPPCVSNWKNANGYTIPLDKRLPADGRNLQQPVISDNFAKFSQALLLAERHAREKIAHENQLKEALRRKEKEQKEEMLRKIAEATRQDRTAPVAALDDDEEKARQERDEVRRERAYERERARRMENMGRKSRAERDARRDISEKVALGLKAPAVASKETQYDARLYNQSGGMDSGFAADDAYNTYDRPLFTGSSANQLYRPRAVDNDTYGSAEDMAKLTDTSRFKPHRDFGDVDRSDDAQRRSGPVQFEAVAQPPPPPQEEADPFGLDDFLSETTTGRRNAQGGRGTLDAIGARGQLHAASAAGTGASADSGSGRDAVRFESAGVRHGSSSSSRQSDSSSASSLPSSSSSARDQNSHRHSRDRDSYRDSRRRDFRERESSSSHRSGYDDWRSRDRERDRERYSSSSERRRSREDDRDRDDRSKRSRH